jgi:hypothetical protein
MAKNIKQYVPIFVSSTYTDLEPYRKAVWNTLDKLKVGVSGMEIFGARSAEPLQTCVDEVMKCEVFIGIIGMRYGSVDEKTAKSFVRVEYETALEKNLYLLIYLIDEEKAQISPKFVDVGESASKLRDFKELLRKKHTIETFQSPEDLGNKVEKDLLRLFSEKSLVIEKEKLQPSVQPEKTIQLLNKFNLMPDRFDGSEVELIIKFSGNPETVPESLCKAIGLRFGWSLSRFITVVHPPKVSRQFKFLNKLYAEYGGCDFLFDASDNKEYKVVAKLAFGQEKRVVLQSDRSLLVTGVRRSTTIKDLETDKEFDNYITHSPVKAVIYVKAISGIA